MKFWKKSLMARLVVYFLLLSLVTISVIGYVAFAQSRQLLQEAALARLEAAATYKERLLNHWIGDRQADLMRIAASPELQRHAAAVAGASSTSTGADYEAAYQVVAVYLADVLSRQEDFQEIFILNQDALIVLSTTPERKGESQQTAVYFNEGQAGPFVQTVYTSPAGGRPSITIAVPLAGEHGGRGGVLAAHLNLDELDRIIMDRTGLEMGGEAYLVDASHHIVEATGRPDGENGAVFSQDVHTAGIDAAVRGKDGAGLYTNHQGIKVIGVYRWLDELNVALLTELPEREALAPASHLGWVLVWVGLLLLAVLTVIVYLLSRQIADPILAVTSTAVQVAAGDLTSTAAVLTEDEIGVLARTFNQMTERLRRVYASLEAQVAARTTELAYRVEQLNLINRVGRQANSLLDLSSLLPNVASLIRGTFNYYAVLVMLIDETSEVLYLSAADTAENIDLPAFNWRLPLSQPTIITHVATTGKARLVNDVSTDPLYLSLNYLPRTRSELTLPLSVAGKVLGVLDLQSASPDAFKVDDMQVMQTLADQIAVAIHNAVLFRATQDARAEAEEANRLKTQFLTNMSHELRTPLNAVINFAYLLSIGIEGPLTESQVDMLERIMEAGRHLLELINDILDLARIESGRVDLFLEAVKLDELVSGVMSTATGLVRDKQIQLRQEVPADLPLVKVDRGRIRQVLLNLVANAAKFTEQGSISVKAVVDSDTAVVSVADTGIGMTADDISQVFAEFAQGDGATRQLEAGSGLGLPISKRFVEMHGGRMWAESKVGEGSIFYFTLPLAPEAATRPNGTTSGPSQTLTGDVDG